jgi:hypothetical protein
VSLDVEKILKIKFCASNMESAHTPYSKSDLRERTQKFPVSLFLHSVSSWHIRFFPTIFTASLYDPGMHIPPKGGITKGAQTQMGKHGQPPRQNASTFFIENITVNSEAN